MGLLLHPNVVDILYGVAGWFIGRRFPKKKI